MISIQVTFSETVNVTGVPTLTLNSGGTANYTSGTGTNVLTFTYTVAAATARPISNATALVLGAGKTIRDDATNNATLTLPGAPNTLARQQGHRHRRGRADGQRSSARRPRTASTSSAT